MLFLFLQSCTEPQPVDPYEDSGPAISTRSITSDSIFDIHNDFIWWLFDNHSDSAFYYADDDPTDFMDFVSRKRFAYDGSDFDLIAELIDADTVKYAYPYYVQNSGFVDHSGWTTAEYDSLYTVLDSAMVSFENGDSEATVSDILSRGKTRIDAIPPSVFQNKHGLLNTLTQAQYSLELLHDMENEYGNGFVTISPCLWASIGADVYAYAIFDENGDFESGATLYFWAMDMVAGLSAYALAKCYG